MSPNSLTSVVEFIHDTGTLNLEAPLPLVYSFLLLSSIAKSSFENIALLVDSCHFTILQMSMFYQRLQQIT